MKYINRTVLPLEQNKLNIMVCREKLIKKSKMIFYKTIIKSILIDHKTVSVFREDFNFTEFNDLTFELKNEDKIKIVKNLDVVSQHIKQEFITKILSETTSDLLIFCDFKYDNSIEAYRLNSILSSTAISSKKTILVLENKFENQDCVLCAAHAYTLFKMINSEDFVIRAIKSSEEFVELMERNSSLFVFPISNNFSIFKILWKSIKYKYLKGGCPPGLKLLEIS